MTDETSEAPPAELEDLAWMKETLPEPPALGPRGTWASEHPVSVLVIPVVSNLMFFGYVSVSRMAPFVLLGLLFAVLIGAEAMAAVFRRIGARRAERLRAEFPHEPWRYDHAWDERGETRTWFVRMAETVQRGQSRFRWVRAIAFGLLAGLAVARLWTLFAIVVGAVATWIAWSVWHLHGAGDAHLYFAKFPFHPGERVTLRFGMGAGGATFRRAEFRLSRVAQIGASRGLPAGSCVRTRSMSEHRPPGELPGSDFDVEVSFDLPPDGRGTHLSGGTPEYWVLDVMAATSSGPYAETFLIPIYERPPA